MTREEFQQYWLDQHGPLACSHANALGIRRYVQAHTLPMSADLRPHPDAPEPFDGLVELWFDSPESLASLRTNPEGILAGAALQEDERRFIDHSRSVLLLVEEHELIAMQNSQPA
jgi:uncharacterized protein (TIGR02118 family)